MFMVASVSPMQPHLEDKCTDPSVLEAAVAFSEGKDYVNSGGGKCLLKLEDGTFLHVKKQPGH